MADDDDGAGEIVDRLDQRLARLDVEMVGRLVEHEEGRRLVGDEGEVEAAPFRRRRGR